ncbi:unnamed protein product [Amaranthus hypochondriacus]
MSSTQSHDLLCFLLKHGSTLASLHHNFTSKRTWKKGPNTKIQNTSMNMDPPTIVGYIHQILEEFEKLIESQAQFKPDKEAFAKVMGLINSIIEHLMNQNDDPIHSTIDYNTLLDRINHLTRSTAESSSRFSFDESSLQAHEYDPYDDPQEEFDIEALCHNLDSNISKIVSFSFPFFSYVSTSIKKKELINWWVGMGFIDDASKGEEILHLLVAEEFIVPISRSRYVLHRRVRSNMEQTSKTLAKHGYESTPLDRLFVLHNGLSNQLVEDQIVAAINTSAYTLNAKTFDRIFRMKNAKVIHLGSWHSQMDYVVIDDIILPFLKELKNLKQVKFLSLQGVGRIQNIPKSVYTLINLNVLDLRACQDLSYLPKGIESLVNLTHLDLSECYQLEYIPKGISKLVELRVLKGFVINEKQALINKLHRNSCSFNELSKLTKLDKLSIRTRRMNFPTSADAQTLCTMQQLNKLKIRWVSSTRNGSDGSRNDDYGFIPDFPKNLKKLELQAAPEISTLLMLGLIANRNNTSLEKLYIRGGKIKMLDTKNYCFNHVKVLRFKYLALLHIDWYEFKSCFPKLAHLEIIKCPHLLSFPCKENGVWEESESFGEL